MSKYKRLRTNVILPATYARPMLSAKSTASNDKYKTVIGYDITAMKRGDDSFLMKVGHDRASFQARIFRLFGPY